MCFTTRRTALDEESVIMQLLFVCWESSKLGDLVVDEPGLSVKAASMTRVYWRTKRKHSGSRGRDDEQKYAA